MPHYSFDAAAFLDQCLKAIQEVIDAEHSSRRTHPALTDLRGCLLTTEHLLFEHFQFLLERERREVSSSKTVHSLLCSRVYPSNLQSLVELLKRILQEKQALDQEHPEQAYVYHQQDQYRSYYQSRNSIDSLLFRLVVILQLCLVRTDDARNSTNFGRRKDIALTNTPGYFSWWIIATVGFAGARTAATAFPRTLLAIRGAAAREGVTIVQAVGGLVLLMSSANAIRKRWGKLWIASRIANSSESLQEWNQQWAMLQFNVSKDDKSSNAPSSSPTLPAFDTCKTQKLVRYAFRDTPWASFWHSQGELRFMMLKRAMDVFYASVGTAITYTGKSAGSDRGKWQLTIASAAAASFYSLIGANRKAHEVTSSSDSARSLIQNAWGMVSLPAIKSLSLQASRLIKGASVADRIEICGVSCFILSKEPAPELAAAIRRAQRLLGRRKMQSNALSTIDEGTEHNPDSIQSPKPFAASSDRHRQRDVIFHLTGGGFFAHIIASDLPFLLDWSAATGAVVICPEYCLLPEHAFPDALHQVEDVYRSLLWGDSVKSLGFEVNRIVVTGESAGGNLAAALCVKICMERDEIHTNVSMTATGGKRNVSDTSMDYIEKETPPSLRLPDALMLSCAVLNLSLDLTLSRVAGTDDPVLPSGLISAISDAYLPSESGISKKNPLVSPIYAADDCLRRFPPTLLFAGSNDPLLDDSVAFNKKLCYLGVESELRAVANLPHAYLGLGTAGFPEAQQVQQECRTWLSHKLATESAC
ncbi:predicted protein [Phaeodactylum tricornutum CCAP 1055/1]|jgi:acetyl esterase/lipase|uniref:Alpha/beta hydrolase fold-3 domain-containing protein n=1 Tax=Phaeodactylum tricornutum (strain CCAP 1055/1) TaxID=556484 RepID=B7FQP4_PHATC|nr:predicted protein [Phaeodactylum tricornutum CCAP 1055/1]EEC51904.1 predicted protein [Phaeodactylum tricornutum CCAP 1055/1]|eukprot:XP_002177441.1 predicted protein [Phaeodactylum tricornutum CCAP 1055/1]